MSVISGDTLFISRLPATEIFPIPFEGLRLVVNKGLSNHFQISHTLTMSSVMPSGYRFGTTYVGTKQVGPGEAYPVLLGEIDPSGNLNANILHQLNPRTKVKFSAQFDDSRTLGQAVTEYRGDDYTASCTLVNVNPVTMSGVGVLQYLQSVTETIDAGAELVYQQGKQIPNGGMAALTVSGRYRSPSENYILSGNLSNVRANACYYHKAQDNLHFGVEVETDFRENTSVGTFGYQFELPKDNFTFKGSIDTNWTVGAVLEKKLAPMPFTLLLSGHVVHGRKPDYRFGCGLMIG